MKMKFRKYSGAARHAGFNPTVYCMFKLAETGEVESFYLGKSIWGWTGRYTGLRAPGQYYGSSCRHGRDSQVFLFLYEHNGLWNRDGGEAITDDHLLALESLVSHKMSLGAHRKLLTTDKVDVGAVTRVSEQDFVTLQLHADGFVKQIGKEIEKRNKLA